MKESFYIYIKRIQTGLSQVAYNCNQELKAIIHDSGAILILFLALIIYPIIYSIAYKNEVLKESEIAVIDLDKSSLSRTYSRMLDATEQIHVTYKLESLLEAESLFYEGKIKGIILIPNDFEKRVLQNKQSQVIVYADASYVLIYKQLYSGAVAATSTLSAGIEVKQLVANGNTFTQAVEKLSPLDISTYQLYNPAAGYATFMIPAIILIAMQQTLLIGIGLVGGTFKEKNKKISQRGGAFTIIAGKTLTYLIIYVINSFTAFLLIYSWFDYPDKGGFLQSFFVLIPYFLSTIFLGFIVSVLFKKRVHSLLFLVFLSPIVLFVSGISWPIEALPKIIHVLSYIFPSTLAVPAFLKLKIQGSDFSSFETEWYGLILQMIIYFLGAIIIYAYNLKKVNKVIEIQE